MPKTSGNSRSRQGSNRVKASKDSDAYCPLDDFVECTGGMVTQGLPVNWYPSADTSKDPKMAFIVNVGGAGTCDLVVFERNGSQYGVKASCHASDTDHLYQPNGRLKGTASTNGCWDFSPLAKLLLHLGGQCSRGCEKQEADNVAISD